MFTHVPYRTTVLYSNQNKKSELTFVQVLSKMRRQLQKSSYTQIPQLTSSHPMNIREPFYIVPPDFHGTKRAVLIGINYVGHVNGELRGCHNDCLNMKNYIQVVWGFAEQNIVVLMDDGYHPAPTRTNILRAYAAVAAVSTAGDAVFCHYSGEFSP